MKAQKVLQGTIGHRSFSVARHNAWNSLSWDSSDEQLTPEVL